MLKTEQIKVPGKIRTSFGITNISFIIQGEFNRISASDSGLKMILDGNTFIAIFDDVRERTTTVYKRDLVSGAEKTRSYDPGDKYLFTTYLQGNEVYRIVSAKEECKLIIHNFETNEIIYSMLVPPINGYERLGKDHDIRLTDQIKSKDTRMNVKTAFYYAGMVVNDYMGQKQISFGIVDKEQPATPAGGPNLAIALINLVAALDQINKDKSLRLIYSYMVGSPQTGFKQITPADNLESFNARIDNFEVKMQSRKMNMDYTAYVLGPDFCIGVVSKIKSGSYTILKFNK